MVGEDERETVVRVWFRHNKVWRDVVGWDRLGRYTQGMVVHLPWVGKRKVIIIIIIMIIIIMITSLFKKDNIFSARHSSKIWSS